MSCAFSKIEVFQAKQKPCPEFVPSFYIQMHTEIK